MSKNIVNNKISSSIVSILSAGAAIISAQKIESKKRIQDEDTYLPPGTLVHVNGKSMHVRIVGSGTDTIVMLPGLGTDGPSLDFFPLASLLADKEIRCVIPEPLGYGFSDDTEVPRTALNIIEDIRFALLSLGVKPPWFLLGHSVSGFYIRIWAHEYPDEVAGLIAEDISLPEQIEAEGIMNTIMDLQFGAAPAIRFLNSMGVPRVIDSFSNVISRDKEKDISTLKMQQFLARRNMFSHAICDEYKHFKDNASMTAITGMPDKPILVLIATGKGSASQIKFKNGFSWRDAHLKLAEEAKCGKAVEIPGAHYLHWTHAEVMADEIEAFISSVDE